jgi:sterol desaturase/sphingolipid hydroxylase (fatty acid hydroxylase superfamily)
LKLSKKFEPALGLLIFPLTMGSALAFTIFGFNYFNWSHSIVAGLAVLVFGLFIISLWERLLPFRTQWSLSDDDLVTDISNLFLNGLVTAVEKPLLVALLVGITAHLSSQFGSDLWPSHWPLIAQLFSMLLIAEFGRYWIHVAAYKVPLLWRLHAVHHSPNRLYFLNASRFHPLEKVLFQLPEVVPFILLGTNVETIALYFVFNSVHGFFQHSNIKVRLGPLNYIFSMTELHRWHHSKLIEESDRNFGNNLIIWDIVFGSFYYPKHKEVGDIGLLNPEYPKSYIGQLRAPFARSTFPSTKTGRLSVDKNVQNRSSK